MRFVKKKWGFEIWLCNNELYCAKELFCRDRFWSSGGKYHYHKKKDETFYIQKGELILDIEGKEYLLKEGNSMRIKKGVKHRFRSYSNTCTILEISTHHDDKDSYRVEKL